MHKGGQYLYTINSVELPWRIHRSTVIKCQHYTEPAGMERLLAG